MDPQLKSVISSILLAISTSATAWAVSKGIIPAKDQSVIANDIVAAVLALAAIAIGWWKARQVAPAALIQQVNAGDNGVKVVAASEPVPQVSEPLKGK